MLVGRYKDSFISYEISFLFFFFFFLRTEDVQNEVIKIYYGLLSSVFDITWNAYHT
jgi:hypothetical protein